jgi:hypothetical protein
VTNVEMGKQKRKEKKEEKWKVKGLNKYSKGKQNAQR